MARRVIACALVVAWVGGCTTRQRPGFVLSPPAPSAKRFGRVLWLEPVQVLEPEIEDPDLQGVAFTYNLARHLRERALFDRVRIRPGTVDPDDWIARVELRRMQEREQASVRKALSIAVSAVVGGRGRLDVAYTAALEIRDASGALVGAAELNRETSRSFGSRNTAEGFAFFLDERRLLMDQLFARALGVEAAGDSEEERRRDREADEALFEDFDDEGPEEGEDDLFRRDPPEEAEPGGDATQPSEGAP